MTTSLETIMCASVVSRETIRIVSMISSLNDLEVESADLLNAYIQATVREMVWTMFIKDDVLSSYIFSLGLYL